MKVGLLFFSSDVASFMITVRRGPSGLEIRFTLGSSGFLYLKSKKSEKGRKVRRRGSFRM